MNLDAAVTAFAIILPAELPDKTVVACLVLGSRYRPSFVFAGAAAAFAVHVAAAVAAGGLLSLLPRRPLQVITSVLFVAGAVLLWRQQRAADDQPEPAVRRTGFLPVAGMSFAVIFVAEFGDLTQIVTANLAATYDDPVAVGIGSALALWTVAGLAIAGGRSLLKVIPVTWLSRAAALVMLALAGTNLAAAIS